MLYQTKFDHVNQTFGRLTCIGPAGNGCWHCRCRCGGEVTVSGTDLRNGRTRSCGCLRREVTRQRAARHGHNRPGSRSAEYTAWANLVQRCTNPNHTSYANYGRRGVKVCRRWLQFENFLVDMGAKPRGWTIERIDNSKGYSKANCCWAPRAMQARNTRRNVVFDGKTIAEWARTLGRNQATIRYRLKKYGSVFLS